MARHWLSRDWPSTDAALRYYILEGFLYVESVCRACSHVQKTLVFPSARVVQCLNCNRMESLIVRDLDPNG